MNEATKLNISTISKLSGLNPHTIRSWEKRYQAIQPTRTSTGQRLYTQNDVERLKSLKSLIDFGYRISEVAQFQNEKLKELASQFARQTETITQNSEAHLLQLQLNKLLGLLKVYKLDEILEELHRAYLSHGLINFTLKLVSPLLQEVGDLVANGSLSISQEHTLSAIVRSQLSKVYIPHLYEAPSKKIALATQEGNNQEFGILLSNIICQYHGCKTYYLGPNMPAESFIDAINSLKPDIAIIGTSLLGETMLDTPRHQLFSYITKIRSHIPLQTEIWIGGYAGQSIPENLAKRVESLEYLHQYLKKNIMPN